MFPDTFFVTLPVQEESTTGSKSFCFDFEKGEFVLQDGRLFVCDGVDALKVWIEKAVHTEKERFEIYLNTNYGCNIEDLIVGTNFSLSFIASELKREIQDALLTNPNILSVTNFKLSRTASKLIIELEVKTHDQGTNSLTLTF